MKKCLALLLTMAIIVGSMSVIGCVLPVAAYTLGDVNGDGSVATYDARLLLTQLVSNVEMTASQKLAADINQDGKINTSDVKQILNAVMNAETGTLTQNVDLLASDLDLWNNPVQLVSGFYCTVKQTEADTGYTFINVTETDEQPGNTGYNAYANPFTWPYTSYSYDEKLLLPRSATIIFDMTVSCSSSSINLYLGGDRPHFDDNSDPTYIPLNSFITTNLDAGSGDLLPGTYTGTVSVASLIDSGKVPDDCLVNGNLWVSGIKLYVVGYNTNNMTVRTLRVDQAYVSAADVKLSTDPLETIRTGLVSSSETAGMPTLTGLELYENGERTSASSMTSTADNKKIYHTESMKRVMNYADGYKIDIPYDWEPDYSLSALRSRYKSDTCVLTVSKEEESPYANTSA